MAENCMFSRGERLEKDQDFDHSMVESQELHVLAVDDCLVDRTVIERLLKISCYKVTSVDSGRRALQFLGLDGEKNSAGIEGLKVNLIITDYCMPGMTGYELLKKIKESSTFKEIPVVIMSSENVVTRINRCLEEGAEGFIVKPVKLSDVKRLKDYITRDEGGQEHVERGETTNNINNNNNNNKRKFQNTSDDDMALTTSSPPLNSTTPSSAPLDSTPSSPMNTKPSSPLDSDSPSRRLRPTNDTL